MVFGRKKTVVSRLKVKNIIGIIGAISAGKDVAGDYIAKKLKIPRIQTSTYIKEYAVQNSISITRSNLIELGKTLGKERGEEYLVQRALDDTERTSIITGIRMFKQLEYLKDQSNFVLIAINCDPKVRFARMQRRLGVIEPATFEEFIAMDKKENDLLYDGRYEEFMNMADYTIDNNGTLDDLYNNLDELLRKVDTRKLR